MSELTKLTLSGLTQDLQNRIVDRLQTAKEPMTALQLANGDPTKAANIYWMCLCMLEGKGVVESNVTLTGAITWRLL